MAVTEKRRLDDAVYTAKHIVMDIEGTTTSISFVKDTLFPYVRKNLEDYISTNWSEEEFKDVLLLLKNQAAEDKKAEVDGVVEIPTEGSDDDVKAAVVKNVLWQMDSDRKTTALKKLQGYMWRKGYKTGELKGHLFADVAPALREWVKDGRKLYVYSSGSVEAQKLLFGNSTDGDLTELFTDFFDTEVGAKTAAESYKSIVEKLGCSADDALFLTDIPKEASAAQEAGLPVILVEREGNLPVPSELKKGFSAVTSFQEVEFESQIKKQKVDPKELDAVPSTEAMEVESVKDNDNEKVTKEPETKVDAMEIVDDSDVKDAVDPAAEPKLNNENKTEDVVPSEVTEKSEADAKADAIVGVEEHNVEAKTDKTPMKKDEKDEVDLANGQAKEEDSEKVEVQPEAEVPKAETAVNQEDKGKIEKSTSETSVSPNSEAVKPDVIEKTDEVSAQKTDDVIPVANDSETKETDTDKKLPKEDLPTDKESKLVQKQVESADLQSCDKVEVVKDPLSDSTGEATEAVKEEAEKLEESKLNTNKTDNEKDSDTDKQNGVVDEKNTVPKSEEKVVSEVTEEKKTEEAVSEKNGDGNATEQGTDKVTEENSVAAIKEKLNGVTNGTNCDAKDTNGKVENGNNKTEEADVGEAIVAKSSSQVEKAGGDAAIAVEV